MPPGFRGVWVTAKHRAQLKLPLSSRLKGPSVPLMQKHLGFPNEIWDSLGSHVILSAIYWISWDFLGIYRHLLDFMGFYWHLIYLLFLVKNHTLLAIYYIRFYGIWWILPGKVQSWTTKTWWFNQEETDSSRSTFRLNASEMGFVDDFICRWTIATVKIPVH